MTDRAQNGHTLSVRGLNVYYGASHALQGVDLELPSGVLSVVGRNGMGKTTLCKAIMGLHPASSGAISFHGNSLLGKDPGAVARMGIGYVPQGRRLWPSLTVDEHLKMVAGRDKGSWTVDRIYAAFPRLAERKSNGGGQLSGGEQQMLAISRALLLNPKLLVMDEPTEGLAPVIVDQVADMLITLADDREMDVLVIEQNIGVATAVSESVAIMVNGQINRVMDAKSLAADIDLQQSLLGVGRHAHDETPLDDGVKGESTAATVRPAGGPVLVYMSNPATPTRWSRPVPVDQIIRNARPLTTEPVSKQVTPLHAVAPQPVSFGRNVALIAGTLDTKGRELRFIRDCLREAGIVTKLVDLSTSGRVSGADVSPQEIAAFARGPGIYSGDRGEAVAAMAGAFEAWVQQSPEIAGIISAGGGGGTALATPAMRSLPVGVPKVMISTLASGDVRPYVGGSDIIMMNAVADIQGLNSITTEVLANGANALAGMIRARTSGDAERQTQDLPALGLTMFGVTTPCIQNITGILEKDFECLVFHATGVGGQSMESLVASDKLSAVLDITTTEVCDLLFGGVLPAAPDRLQAIVQSGLPYIGSCGALDMINFGPRETVPPHYADRQFYQHNPQVTLMRTTVDECIEIGKWLAVRLNRMTGQVRFLLPEGGVSALDAPDQPFWSPDAREALFRTLEREVDQSVNRRVERVPHHINSPAFAASVLEHLRAIHAPFENRKGGTSRYAAL